MKPTSRLTPARTALCALSLLAAASLAPVLASDVQWIHIRVQDKGAKGETVRVNVPVTMLETLAPVINDIHIDTGDMKVGDRQLDRASLRSMWEAVNKAGDAEFVTVESQEESVRVARQGNDLVIKVDGSPNKPEKVDARIPVAVVDALLSGTDDQLNFAAALEALKTHGSGELIAVDDTDSHVRIWIDSKNSDK
jgi:hypothetical protein